MHKYEAMIESLSKDTFFIKNSEDEYIISHPLRGYACKANAEAVEYLRSALSRPGSAADGQVAEYMRQVFDLPERTIRPLRRDGAFASSISLILTQQCNFECTYCFAHDARGKESMTDENIRFIIDSWAAEAIPHKKVTFIGGGEPTMKWGLLERAISYVRERVGNVEIVLVTNGSLISHDRLVFLRDAGVTVSLSFDILPEIQERQRRLFHGGHSSFRIVDSFLKEAARIGYRCEIRSTITPDTVERMTEMVRFVHDHYDAVRRVHFEHVTSCDNPPCFYGRFEEEFFKARAVGREVGIEVYNSITASQGKVRSAFCRGTSCFVPAGKNSVICTACHRVSSSRDELIDVFKYAEIDGDGDGDIHFHPARYETLRGIQKECESCPAKWQCAGGCLNERLALTPELQRMKCEMVRGFNRRLLLEKLNEP